MQLDETSGEYADVERIMSLSKARHPHLPQDRLKRRGLLDAALQAFPTEPFHPYAEASARYRQLFAGRVDSELEGMLLARLGGLMRRWRKYVDEQLKRHGENIIRTQTLFELAINEKGETLTSIATRVGVVGPTLVGILEELERDGLIKRTIDKKDRRAKLIVLTPAGEKVVFSMFELELKLRQEFLEGVGRSEILLMLEAVEIMKSNLDRILTIDD